MDYKPYQKQRNQQTGDFRPQGPRPQKKEYGAGKVDYVICPECHCVYLDKGWHHSLDQDIDRLKEDKEIQFEKCPACIMIENKQFEGEVVVEGPPVDNKDQIKNMVENSGDRAFEEDPMDRVISIQEKQVERPTAQEKRGKESREQVKGRTDLRVLTTENQLAVRIAKKIEQSFGAKPELDIKYSHQDQVARAKVIFSEED